MTSPASRRDLLEAAAAEVRAHDPAALKALGLLPRHDLFFPAIYYPPLTMYEGADGRDPLAGFEWTGRDRTCLYVHIPQCPSRCTYCHWMISLSNSPADIDLYLDHLEKEMDLWRSRLGGAAPRPSSVLIGGGTPTLLSAAQLERLLTALAARCDLSLCRQFSVEAEPATLLGAAGLEKLRVMKDLGVDRISMGVQALDDAVLKHMARPHDAAEAVAAIRQIRRAGIASVSIDLIYGFPGSTPEKWAETMETALSLDIDACQLYRLRIVPHGDKVGAVRESHRKSPDRFPPLEEVYLMKALGKVAAERRGFAENLRRLFTRSPRHISYYLRDYGCRLYDNLGIGVSSWSSLGDRLLMNTGTNLKAYYAMIAAGRLPVDRVHVRTVDDERRRTLVLPLKGYGVSKTRYRERTGRGVGELFGPRIALLEKHGLLEQNEARLALTPRGGFFADEVIMQFYAPRYLPFPREDYAAAELNPHRPAGTAATLRG
ncbi:MAG: coproporphyrinogen III oxidase family protein [Elusimicrobia bacterium]|nr:coproporphyrinogen III oxidase family protein [Elusimicrobiota bacterium]